MCWAAIMSGEESCKGCDGYTTCPNSTVWEEDWTEDEWEELYETWRSEYDYSRIV